ncbi:MAG: glycoside hydrolase family 13 protein [Clostridiales bacterium]|nr:glycoside hydrolase family 13 protein [Clostridiales bacterium]
MRFYHHSRNLTCRDPQGAVPAGTDVKLTLDILEAAEDVSFSLAITLGGQDLLLPMTVGRGRALAATAAITVTMPDVPGLCHYYFVIRRGDRVWYYGAGSGEGALGHDLPPAWQITVYRANYATPRWFCESLCYQIFPDRFARSDKELARKRVSERAASGRAASFHEDWTAEPDYRPNMGRPYYAPDDYFGGDLAGITEKLPYLKDLGVTCLYLNPIFEAFSNHRYNTADYLAVDSILGDQADYDNLAREAGKLGISLMLDGVFSHTGDDSVYFDRYGRYGNGACGGQDSPYYNWYHFFRYPDQYECWWNFNTLPNVREMEPSYLDFITGGEGVLAHWQKRGAMGWRLDVADELPDDFIRALRTRVKAENPEAVLLGEVWEDCSNKLGHEGRRAYVDGDLLDSAMNYPFRDAVLRFAAGQADAFDLNEVLQTLRENYPAPFWQACLNLLSSHDEVRALTYLSGAPHRKTVTRETQAHFKPKPEHAAFAKQRFLLATALCLIHTGVPCLYYGDEVGMEGMGDPFNRRAYPWGNEDKELLEAVRTLTLLRAESNALRRGCMRMGALGRDIFAVLRYTVGCGDSGAPSVSEQEVVILLVNASQSERNVILYPGLLVEGADATQPVMLAGQYKDLFTRETVQIGEVYTGTLAPFETRVLRKT